MNQGSLAAYLRGLFDMAAVWTEILPESRYSGTPSGDDFVNAAGFGRVEDVSKALRAGQDVNYRKQPLNDTALMYAAYFGHLQTVKVLLASKPDLELTDANHATALRHATSSKHANIIRLLRRASSTGPKSKAAYMVDRAKKL